MQKQSKLSKRLWNFESLEPRNLLAGNVTADVTTNPGTLTIIGDNSANVITITQVAADTFKVAGAGTKVNGSNSAQTFSVSNGVLINMNGGNDSLTIKGLSIPGDAGGAIGLGIMLGDGTDALVLSGTTVEFATAIDGGSGVTAIAIDKCTFDSALGIQTYSSADAVTITNSHVCGALNVALGDGTNALAMVNDTVTGSDCLYDRCPLPSDFEILECALPQVDCGATISGGSGVDAIAMNKVQIDCLTEIDTCSGVDSVAIVNSQFGNQLQAFALSANVVSGDDASGLCIETGLGNDVVAITTTTVYGFLQIDTSGEVCCPCCDSNSDQVQPATPTTSSVKDGNDAVALVKVNVYAAGEAVASGITPAETSNSNCCLEDGELLIYTGNQVDAVALTSVCTDSFAYICTTDCEKSSLDGTDAVAIANSKFNQEDTCTRDVGLCIFTGNGNDAVSIAKTNVVGKAVINTGAGTDAVALAFLVADEICADVGTGSHDVLTVSNCTATDEAFSDEGTGGLLNYKHLNNHFTNSPNVSGFATIV